MKVLHLISGGDAGGAKTHVHLLLETLSRDIEVRLCCFIRGEFSEEAVALGIPTVDFDGRGFVRTFLALRKMVRTEGYELVHCHGSRANLMGTLLKLFTPAPVLSTVHSDPRLDYLGRPFAKVTYGVLNACALRMLDYRVAVSEAMRRLLISRGFAPNRIFTIHNGVEIEAPLKTVCREEGAVTVGIAARLHPVKDVATLLRGFALAFREAPNLRLRVAGDGPDRAALEALSKELGIGGAVRFLGWVSDMDAFYAALDVNALTSLSETFPYVLTEGARYALPTVSSRVGGVPELISHGETGLLFPPGDEKALSALLLELARDRALRERLGAALRNRVWREFSGQATAERQKAIYAEVLRREALGKRGRDGVLLCGAYGHGNVGDDGILEAILLQLKGIDPFLPVTVLARRPKETATRFGVDVLHTFDIFKFLPLMRRTILYINGGGSLIQDVTSKRSLWYYLFTLRRAKARGCKVLMYACGIGPVLYEDDVKRVRRDLNACVDMITLRESHSAEELARFGVTKPEIIVSSDPALTLPPADDAAVDALFLENGIDPGGNYICFALRKWKGALPSPESFVAAAKAAYEQFGLASIFLSVNYRSDSEAAKEAMSKLDIHVPYFSIFAPLGPSLTIGVLRRMKIVLSMRLHALIFAASQGVPVIGVVYDPKVSAFMQSIGRGAYVELDALSPETLVPLMESTAQMAAEPEQLRENVKRLLEVEERNVDAVRKLLGKEVK
ncbi:MAG: polysaccharide pyruvyl transferase family protein [Firmicutes bacterium]|nr:polysaccharide pyruvyl transferase family protein [Bacillota bacterium]